MKEYNEYLTVIKTASVISKKWFEDFYQKTQDGWSWTRKQIDEFLNQNEKSINQFLKNYHKYSKYLRKIDETGIKVDETLKKLINSLLPLSAVFITINLLKKDDKNRDEFVNFCNQIREISIKELKKDRFVGFVETTLTKQLVSLNEKEMDDFVDNLTKLIEVDKEKTKTQKQTTNLTAEKVNSKTESQKVTNTGLKTKPKSREDDEWER